jgi:predicted nucleic acid-binding Zn ribbon protein
LAGLADRWAEIVGPEVAEHVQIESWAEGELVLRADSTAWATQVRLLSATLLEQVREAVGSGIVEKVQVNGPSAPSWRAGPRVVKGRGPRDTYG